MPFAVNPFFLKNIKSYEESPRNLHSLHTRYYICPFKHIKIMNLDEFFRCQLSKMPKFAYSLLFGVDGIAQKGYNNLVT